MSVIIIIPYSGKQQDDEHTLSPFVILADFYSNLRTNVGHVFIILTLQMGKFRENGLIWAQAIYVSADVNQTLPSFCPLFGHSPESALPQIPNPNIPSVSCWALMDMAVTRLEMLVS